MLHIQSGGKRKASNPCLSYFSVAVIMARAIYRRKGVSGVYDCKVSRDLS